MNQKGFASVALALGALKLIVAAVAVNSGGFVKVPRIPASTQSPQPTESSYQTLFPIATPQSGLSKTPPDRTQSLKKGYGILEGSVLVGPSPRCPAQAPGTGCPIPPEMYTSREVVIYKIDRPVIVARAHFHEDGTYHFELPAGAYVVDIGRNGMGSSKDVPRQVLIKNGEIVRFDFRIDTGVR